MEPNFWPKWAQKYLEASIKNLATFVSQEFSPRTAAKIIMENINCSRSYNILSDGHVGKTPN